MKRTIGILVVAGVWLGLPVPTRACSVGPGYLMPSNFELVRDAGAIVEAKAVSFIRKEDYVVQGVFEVLQVLKGQVDEKSLTLMATDRWLGASDPSDFSRARPGAFRGACIAYDYKLQSRFLLFLKKQGRDWTVSGPPFTRVNEEVSGSEAPWYKAVQHYARIAALGSVELQKAALRRLSEEGGIVDGLVQDIDRHFHSPHGSKPFDDLKDLLDKAPDDHARAGVLWAFANGRHTDALPIVRDLIQSGAWSRFVGPVAEFVGNLRERSLVDPLLEALRPENRASFPNGRWDILWAVARAADAAHAKGMLDVLKAAEGEEVRPLMKYYRRHPDPKAAAELLRRINKEYGKDDSNVTTMVFGAAAMGEPDVVTWALESAKKPGERRWVAYYVLAISPLPEADRAAHEILKGADVEAIAMLLQGYGESAAARRIQRLLEGFALRKEHAELDQWVRHSLSELARDGDADAAAALQKLPEPPEK